jgi:hypothetical protein
VVRNRIVNASDDGIEVDTGSVLLRRNRIARTQKDGIALNSHRNILLRNIIVRVGRCAVDDRGRKNHLEGNRLEDGVEFDCIGRHNDD